MCWVASEHLMEFLKLFYGNTTAFCLVGGTVSLGLVVHTVYTCDNAIHVSGQSKKNAALNLIHLEFYTDKTRACQQAEDQ